MIDDVRWQYGHAKSNALMIVTAAVAGPSTLPTATSAAIERAAFEKQRQEARANALRVQAESRQRLSNLVSSLMMRGGSTGFSGGSGGGSGSGKDAAASASAGKGTGAVRGLNDVLLANQPQKKFVQVEQLAALAVFLCRDEASAITGTNLSVDGGWTAQ
jgi:NAD(P)-dependent dehydrogenase (short-subunit alcohol dehydrogenase family)